MFTALLANAAAATLLMQPGPGNTQTAARDPLEGGWLGRSANWVENAGSNFLYHNEGGGLRKVMINTASPYDGNTYFTVNANVAGTNQFVGMAMASSNSTAFPFYAYAAGSDKALHWFNPNADAWFLSINSTNVLKVSPASGAEFYGDVSADAYYLNTPRSEFIMSSRLDGGPILTSGEQLHRVHIRDGSEIVQFQARIQDLNPSANLQIFLMRTDFSAATLTTIASVSSSGSGTTFDYSTSTITGGTGVVDNSQYLYYVYYAPVANTEFMSARTQIFANEL